MKRIFFFLVFVMLIGAGCAKKQTAWPAYTPAPAGGPLPASDTDRAPETWNAINVSAGDSIIRVLFPGSLVAASMNSADQVLSADLGTAVEQPGEKAVPGRSLRVLVVDPQDERMRNCAFSENEWTSGRVPDIRTDLAFGEGEDLLFCESKENEGAAGNRYAVYTYTTPIGGRILALQFTVHSLVCENFDDPEAHCVAFDEARDTAIFSDILSRIAVE